MTTAENTDQQSRRRLGPTELLVTAVCLGCAPLGDMPDTFDFSVPDDRAHETLRTAFASTELNFIDTAASYGDGTAERRIGVVLAEIGGLPQGYVLGTKADRDLETGEYSGEQIKRSVERSLRLMGLDRLQLCHLHDPEHSTYENVMSKGGPVEVLLRFKEEGVIGAIGVAGGPIDMSIQYVETGVFDAVITHNRYTLLNRSAEPLLEIAASRGLGVLNAAPYGSGMLAKGPDEYARYAYQEASPEIVERARKIEAVCEEHGVPLAAVALQFSMRDPRITSTIVGMTRPERVEQTLELARLPIPEELWPELEAIGTSSEDPESGRWK